MGVYDYESAPNVGSESTFGSAMYENLVCACARKVWSESTFWSKRQKSVRLVQLLYENLCVFVSALLGVN